MSTENGGNAGFNHNQVTLTTAAQLIPATGTGTAGFKYIFRATANCFIGNSNVTVGTGLPIFATDTVPTYLTVRCPIYVIAAAAGGYLGFGQETN